MEKTFLFEETAYSSKDGKKYGVLEALYEAKNRYSVRNANFDTLERYCLVERSNKPPEYKSKFVGFVYFKNELFVSLPKYAKYLPSGSEEAYESIYRSLARLLHKYREILSYDELMRSEIRDMSNEIYAADVLGTHYIEHGLYKARRTRYGADAGSVMWGRTIMKRLPMLSDERPVYTKFEYRKQIDVENEISEIQEALLYYLFEECRYGDVLQINPEVLSSRYSLAQLTDNPQYLHLLEEKKLQTFDDDTLELLDAMIGIIQNNTPGKETANRKPTSQVYGISRFEELFEAILGDCLENRVRKKNEERKAGGNKLTVEISSKWFEGKVDFNKAEYAPITWDYQAPFQDNEGGKSRNFDISIPDVITEYTVDGQRICFLIDAKYYTIRRNSTSDELFGYPGRDSVAKQSDYKWILEKIYREKIPENAPRPVIYNVFVMPKPFLEGNTLFSCQGCVDYRGEYIYLMDVNMSELVRQASATVIASQTLHKNRTAFWEALKSEINRCTDVS